jgi:hypothetical protein
MNFIVSTRDKKVVLFLFRAGNGKTEYMDSGLVLRYKSGDGMRAL